MYSRIVVGSVILALVLFSCVTNAQEFRHKGYDSSAYDYFEIKGATFGKGVEKDKDTAYIVDPLSGEEIMKVYERTREVPTSVNGKKIYRINEVTKPAQHIPGTVSVEEYLLEHLKDYFSNYKLDSFTITVPFFDVVADENGKVVYFVLGGVRGRNAGGQIRSLNNLGLGDKIGEILKDAPTLKPAILNGKAVPAFTAITFNDYEVVLQKPVVTYRKVSPR